MKVKEEVLRDAAKDIKDLMKMFKNKKQRRYITTLVEYSRKDERKKCEKEWIGLYSEDEITLAKKIKKLEQKNKQLLRDATKKLRKYKHCFGRAHEYYDCIKDFKKLEG